MNSLQKQIQGQSANPQESFLLSFEKSLLVMDNVLEVEVLMKKLQFLGMNFNPFENVIEGECKQIIDQLGLHDQVTNPYTTTNLLLRLLDKTEERINNLKQ